MARRKVKGKDRQGAVRTFVERHWALLAVFVVLFGTMDDRHPDKPSDSWQIIKTAVAISETGEIGMAAGVEAPRALVRKEGDAVSRYGMGMSLAQVPAAFLAPWVERTVGPARSQPLFLVAPFLFVLLAAWLAGAAARLLGAGDRGASAAILLAGLGSPLGSYAAWSFSESMQAAAVAAAFCGSLAAALEPLPRRSRLLALGAGLGAGLAVLAKSSLLVVGPLALLPLLARRDGKGALRRLSLGAAGALLPLAAWLAFEIVRFGTPLTSYGGEGFTHPLLDGLWRLLVGPNKGLLFYFPAFVVALLAIALQVRRGAGISDARLLAAISAASVFVALLVTSATWWSWHGMVGWGPRFLVPAVPLLAPWAGVWLDARSVTLRRALLAVSILLNVPPLLVHPALVEGYIANIKRIPVDAASRRQFPDVGLETGPNGSLLVPPMDTLAEVPMASGHVVFPWYFRLGFFRDEAALCKALDNPPWISSRPDLSPRLVPTPPEVAHILVLPFRWSFFGRSFVTEADRTLFGVGPVYLKALADQVQRAHQTGKLERALALAEKLAELSRTTDAEPLVAESLRRLGRNEALQEYLSRSRSLGDRMNPALVVVGALWARDRGDEATARRMLATAAAYPGYAGAPIENAVSAPLGEWPPDLYSMSFGSPDPVQWLKPALPAFEGTSR